MVSRVLVDANVLFARTLRDWLFLLRNQFEASLFTVAATEDIVAETIYRVRRRYPEAPGRLTRAIHDRIVDQLDERVDDFEVDGSWEGADLDDAHVHAAAVAAGSTIVLTADRGFRDLGQDGSDGLPYEVFRPDEFFVLVDDAGSAGVREVVRQQMDYWYARRGEVDLPDALRRSACPEFARRVAAHVRSLGWTPPS
jgi:predicted nucleic acid-binding protein